MQAAAGFVRQSRPVLSGAGRHPPIYETDQGTQLGEAGGDGGTAASCSLPEPPTATVKRLGS